MKVTVERQLSGGVYSVLFKVGDFTPEELQKMGSFGVPTIKLQWLSPNGGQIAGAIALNQINERYKAGFTSQQAAKAFEENVLGQIREAMQSLRERKDDFTSSSEVAI